MKKKDWILYSKCLYTKAFFTNLWPHCTRVSLILFSSRCHCILFHVLFPLDQGSRWWEEGYVEWDGINNISLNMAFGTIICHWSLDYKKINMKDNYQQSFFECKIPSARPELNFDILDYFGKFFGTLHCGNNNYCVCVLLRSHCVSEENNKEKNLEGETTNEIWL